MPLLAGGNFRAAVNEVTGAKLEILISDGCVVEACPACRRFGAGGVARGGRSARAVGSPTEVVMIDLILLGNAYSLRGRERAEAAARAAGNIADRLRFYERVRETIAEWRRFECDELSAPVRARVRRGC